MATRRPNVKAICGIVGPIGNPIVDAMPMDTRRKVPQNSAISTRHILRLSVISATPTIFFIPEN